jgi:serine/threonine-protein kinase
VPLPRAADPRGNAAPSWRWARPGATLIAAAMIASAVATTAWHFGRAESDTPDTMTTVPTVLAASSPAQLPQRGTAGKRVPQRAGTTTTGAPRQPGGTDDAVKTARPATASRVPHKETRSPQPEAKPYGPWQCTPRFAFDLTSKTPMATKPCQMLGRDIQYRASLTAPGGGTGSITVTVQDAATGRTVAGPKTCDDLTFGGDAATRSCGPATARPGRGRQYTVVMAFRYQRDGRALSGTAKGSAFAW